MSYKHETFAEKHLDIKARSGAEFMIMCPFHENTGSASMQFNAEKGLFVCFNIDCGAKGGMKKLAHHLNIQYQDPIYDVNDLIGKLNALSTQSTDDLQLTVLPEEWLSRYRFPTVYWGPCPEELDHRPDGCRGRPGCKLHRWLTENTIRAFDLGYDPLENAAIIPLRNQGGGLIGAIQRYLDPDVELRYKYPFGFKRSKELFGSWLIEHSKDDTVALVEGSLDAASIWQAGFQAGAVYGSSISTEQIRTLLRLGVREVVQFFDNDKAGQQAERYSLGWRSHLRNGERIWEYNRKLDLSRHFFISRVSYEGMPGKDPGSLYSHEIQQMMDSRVPIY